jgi:hypothetical protein
MVLWNEIERRKRDTAELVLCSNHLGIVLSVIVSLAIVAISSKNHVSNSLWFVVAAFALPIPIVLHFRKSDHWIWDFHLYYCHHCFTGRVAVTSAAILNLAVDRAK